MTTHISATATADRPQRRPASRKGRGLNSIPIRFALLAAILASLSALAHGWLLDGTEGRQSGPYLLGLLLTGLVPVVVTYAAANRLTNSIRALRASTDSILAGRLDRPVDVDCACEVGGLADSFREMVGRLNSNIVRMNVLAYTDTVTGLPNRAVVTHVLGLMKRDTDRWSGALLFIDLDGFKRVNDTLGHEAGDDLLQQVSTRIIEDGLGRRRTDVDSCTNAFGELCGTLPQDVMVARFAGDEFVVLMPGLIDRDRLETCANRVLAAVNEPFLLQGGEVRIGSSIGIARFPADAATGSDLLNFADLAMYRAKEEGRHRCVFFDSSLRDLAIDRAALEADLRRAIEAGELQLHYQPQLDAATGALVGVEALVRWDHPTRGPVPPDTFVGLAEQSGLMHALGTSILWMAARQARAWAEMGWTPTIALNVSAVQFTRPDFVDDALLILRHEGVDPARLEFEVTESMVATDFNATRRRFEELRAAGALIAVDDFGRGYSNLSQIAMLPFDVLKIDRTLIDGIGTDEKTTAIVRAIVDMAHALGHQVVAEGIELDVQRDFLLSVGCDRLQGYLFGYPQTPDALLEWHANRSAASWPSSHGAKPREETAA
jgi:predicted signal transduction protein with EAL and GGDEF domain